MNTCLDTFNLMASSMPKMGLHNITDVKEFAAMTKILNIVVCRIDKLSLLNV